MERERALFRERHAKSRALFEAGRDSLLYGVPMNWMVRWPGDHPVYVAEAQGAPFTDVDGNEFFDFCLCDIVCMAVHAT
jgi:glutamate-1-semialdehyde 2,1-aminomutase